MGLLQYLCFGLVFCQVALAAKPCIQRDFQRTSFVCVCNSTYCDEPDPVERLPKGQILQVTSDRVEKRFEPTVLTFETSNIPLDSPLLVVQRDDIKQRVTGFGGAFTDAAAINIASLNDSTQDYLLSSYYGPNGLSYSTGRVNMGGCDFSPRPYTLADTPDPDLTSFALQTEDIDYKIPIIRKANSLHGKDLHLFASPWTAPPWMKNNSDYTGYSHLLPEYYQTWANYFVKFLDAYKANGVDFWGVTAQNEPSHGASIDMGFNSMGWTAEGQMRFVADNLGPSLEQAGYENVKVIIHDDQRTSANDWVDIVLANPKAFEFTDGIGMHWYLDIVENIVPTTGLLDRLNRHFPDKFLLYTEACNGFGEAENGAEHVNLGSWNRGEKYLQNILEDLNHHVVGWTDWNIALDMEGGPNWAGMRADAPIIVNAEKDEFYKQPMYYAMGHVSRFVPEGSFVVGVDEIEDENGNDLSNLVRYSASERPDGGIALTIMNKDLTASVAINIVDPKQGFVHVELDPASMHTFLFYDQ